MKIRYRKIAADSFDAALRRERRLAKMKEVRSAQPNARDFIEAWAIALLVDTAVSRLFDERIGPQAPNLRIVRDDDDDDDEPGDR